MGELIEKGERLIEVEAFQYRFQPAFPRAPACFSGPVAAIEFATKVPWVFAEDPY
ncbi:MAG: hypothetical protein ABSE28_20385 [Candidatus Sulfotelmatobacter sp.]